MRKKISLKEKRLNRVRIRIGNRSEDRHRLSVFRSNKNIYAQGRIQALKISREI